MKRLILLIVVLTFSLGCSNYRELNEIEIVSGMAIDLEDGKYNVSVQTLNSKKDISNISNINEPTFEVYEKSNKTIQEALRDIVSYSPNRLYTTHMSLLVLSEDVAKEGIYNILDLLLRDTESRKQFFVVIAKGSKAKEIISTITSAENNNTTDIIKSIKSKADYIGTTNVILYEDLIEMYINKNKDIYLPTVSIINKNDNYNNTESLTKTSNKQNIKIDTLAIFKNDKLIDYLNEKESLGVSFINNKVKKTLIRNNCGKNAIIVEILESKTKISTRKNIIGINIKATANINEITCKINLEKEKNIQYIQKVIEKKINNIINSSVKKAIKENNSDIFGFKDILYKNNPNYFIKNKININDLVFKTNVEVKIIEKGNTLKVIKDEN